MDIYEHLLTRSMILLCLGKSREQWPRCVELWVSQPGHTDGKWSSLQSLFPKIPWPSSEDNFQGLAGI